MPLVSIAAADAIGRLDAFDTIVDARSESEYALVQKMLEQKYPGEEIERMVRALRGGESPTAIRTLERMRG